ncbi:hypothetical protein FB451DRAFT_1208660 [Mycena latifolia]|nr:hypothetical protein FB451DRAFT_1208660 [Mycena latifolia]
MDPLSIVSAIPDLVSKINAVYQFAQKYRRANDSWAKLAEELETTRQTFAAVNEYIGGLNSEDEKAEDPVLRRIRDGFGSCQKMIDQLDAKFKPQDKVGPVKKVIRRLKFTWNGDEEVRAFYDELEKHNRNFGILLDIKIGSTVTKVHLLQIKMTDEQRKEAERSAAERGRQDEERIRQEAERIKQEEERTRAKEELFKEQRQSLIRWLYPAPFDQTHLVFRAQRQEGTCEWLMKTKEFSTWTSVPGSCLWLHGIPGNGKSVFASSVIEYLRHNYPDSITIFFYVNFREQRSTDPIVVFQALLAQLLFKVAPGDTFQNLLQRSSTNQSPPMDLSELVQLLYQVCSPGKRVFVVIDALDECPVDQRQPLLVQMAMLAKQSPSGCISLLATSRKEPDIADMFGQGANASVIALTEHTSTVGQDIEVYVRKQLHGRTKLMRWPETLKQEILEALLSKADGMFRWVDLQLDLLEKQPSESALRNTLEKLPKDIIQSYNRILLDAEDIGNIASLIVRRALHLIIGSFKALTLSEIAEAVMIEPSQIEPDTRFRVFAPSVILEYCSSLVDYNESEETVKLSHFTVQEYLFSSELLKIPELKHHGIVSSDELHSELASSMMTYLSYGIFDDSSDARLHQSLSIPAHPFFAYAACWWIKHTLAVHENSSSFRHQLMAFIFSSPHTQSFRDLTSHFTGSNPYSGFYCPFIFPRWLATDPLRAYRTMLDHLGEDAMLANASEVVHRIRAHLRNDHSASDPEESLTIMENMFAQLRKNREDMERAGKSYLKSGIDSSWRRRGVLWDQGFRVYNAAFLSLAQIHSEMVTS